ncbi:WhiB family transcriptional regulator [Microbacterium thalli]|uniref:WhiB family transcriptional regulator n=1 Tax=Microbacterium thalli TaxID=3027921 RepID=UPI003B675463
MSAANAWAALQDALATTTPLCANDSRFISDGRSVALTRQLQNVCSACPILDTCRDYATTARPHTMAGYWGGAWRGKPMRGI